MPPRVRTLLHLSDLHFGPPDKKGHYWNSESTELELAEYNRRGLLGSLVRDLRQQNIKPDLVVVTGDLLDRAAEAGVPMAVEFLAGLCEKLNLPRRRVVLIPGNHDVQRVARPEDPYRLFDRLWHEFHGAEQPRFDPTKPPHLRVTHFDFLADLGLEVVGFNSCEALDPVAKQEHGSVGTAQRDYAEELLEKTEGQRALRIAAMHHHLVSPAGIVRDDYSVMDDAALTLQWLVKRHFHLVLHGHQHVDWHEQRPINGWSITIAAAGSAGVANYGRSQWHLQLGYQVLVLEGDSKGRRIRREYNPQTREWVEAGRGSPEQELRFGVGGDMAGGTRKSGTAPSSAAPSNAEGPVQLFISYSRKDEPLRSQLEMFLKPLQRQGVLSTWHDRMIDAGEERTEAHSKQFDQAEVILLLVSASYLASEQNDAEVRAALERHEAGTAVVIPVILRDVNWERASFAKLQPLPTNKRPVTKWPDRDSAWLDVSEGIVRVVERLRGKRH